MPFIKIQNHIVNFRLRRSQRAKRLQLVVRHPLFEIVAPSRVSNQEILSFVQQNQRWMVKHLKQKEKSATPSHFTWPKDFLAGEALPYRNTKIGLNVKIGTASSFMFHDYCLTLKLSAKKIRADLFEENVKAQVYAWYQQEALKKIKESMDYFCPKLKRWPKSYHLKQQKTRWGSCGIEDKIYINWVLILAPPGVLEYVVAHELCHLFHRNHGKRFWAKVAFCFPEYAKYRAWLRQHGHELLSLS